MNKIQPFTRRQIYRFIDLINNGNKYIKYDDIRAVEIEYPEDGSIPKVVWHSADGFVGKDSVDKYFSTDEDLKQFLDRIL